MSHFYHRNKILGFTLIELMIVVAIVGVLAAVGIPSYLGYVRRSYVNEATSSIAAIKSAEESYFTIHGCYVSANPRPSVIPSGNQMEWGTTDDVWGRSGLSVRPDRLVRFQYRVYASNAWAADTACDDPDATYGDRDAPIGCGATTIDPSDVLVNAVVFPNHWFFVVASGNLNGDGVSSNILSAIDDSAVIYCNETE